MIELMLIFADVAIIVFMGFQLWNNNLTKEKIEILEGLLKILLDEHDKKNVH